MSGNASDIGSATATLFGEASATIVSLDVDGAGNRATVESICEAGGTAVAHEAAVTDPKAMSSLVEATVSEFGSIDVVAIVAGINSTDDVLNQPLSVIRDVVTVNLLGS